MNAGDECEFFCWKYRQCIINSDIDSNFCCSQTEIINEISRYLYDHKTKARLIKEVKHDQSLICVNNLSILLRKPFIISQALGFQLTDTLKMKVLTIL